MKELEYTEECGIVDVAANLAPHDGRRYESPSFSNEEIGEDNCEEEEMRGDNLEDDPSREECAPATPMATVIEPQVLATQSISGQQDTTSYKEMEKGEESLSLDETKPDSELGEQRQVPSPSERSICQPPSIVLETDVKETEVDETEVEETEADETEADETEVDETEADETEVDETEADETEADETEVEDTEADETEADETEVEDTEVEETEVDVLNEQKDSSSSTGGDKCHTPPPNESESCNQATRIHNNPSDREGENTPLNIKEHKTEQEEVHTSIGAPGPPSSMSDDGDQTLARMPETEECVNVPGDNLSDSEDSCKQQTSEERQAPPTVFKIEVHKTQTALTNPVNMEDVLSSKTDNNDEIPQTIFTTQETRYNSLSGGEVVHISRQDDSSTPQPSGLQVEQPDDNCSDITESEMDVDRMDVQYAILSRYLEAGENEDLSCDQNEAMETELSEERDRKHVKNSGDGNNSHAHSENRGSAMNDDNDNCSTDSGQIMDDYIMEMGSDSECASVSHRSRRHDKGGNRRKNKSFSPSSSLQIRDIMGPLDRLAQLPNIVQEKKYAVLPSIGNTSVLERHTPQQTSQMDTMYHNQLDYTRDQIEDNADFFADYRINTSLVKATPRQNPLPPIGYKQSGSTHTKSTKRS